MQRNQRQFSTIQDRYIKWATARGIDALTPQPEQLLNWLASGVAINKWSSGTVQAYKAAVIHMYEDIMIQTFKLFFRALRHQEIKHTKELDIDLTPVLAHLRQQGPNDKLNILPLTKKLYWPLGICGFLRPNDIQCIDLSNNRFHLDYITSYIPHHDSEEDPRRQADCRYTTIKAHPKNTSIQYRLLIRHARDFNEPIGTEYISKHISSLSELISLPKDAKLPKACAIGSTASIKQGAIVDDVVYQGCWSFPIIFDQFYRLNAATATNFTSMVLS